MHLTCWGGGGGEAGAFILSYTTMLKNTVCQLDLENYWYFKRTVLFFTATKQHLYSLFSATNISIMVNSEVKFLAKVSHLYICMSITGPTSISVTWESVHYSDTSLHSERNKCPRRYCYFTW